jgi:hypothetical protein
MTDISNSIRTERIDVTLKSPVGVIQKKTVIVR